LIIDSHYIDDDIDAIIIFAAIIDITPLLITLSPHYAAIDY
jgi:hypothetical protein